MSTAIMMTPEAELIILLRVGERTWDGRITTAAWPAQNWPRRLSGYPVAERGPTSPKISYCRRPRN